VSFFSEDRVSELKELFFESAAELLQSLNEEGLQLEKRPGDAEVVREVRRTIHTLKGDSAACGYHELSELAHELEDILTPELAQSANGHVAEVVLTAADTFQMMLAAYRANQTPPSGEQLRGAIHQLIIAPGVKSVAPSSTQPQPYQRFAWTEYHRLVMVDAVKRGLKVLQISLTVDPACMLRGAAVQMAKNALQELGNVLVLSPEQAGPADAIDFVEAALATSFDPEYVAGKCRIPTVISEVAVERFSAAANSSLHPERLDVAEAEEDLLGILAIEPQPPGPQLPIAETTQDIPVESKIQKAAAAIQDSTHGPSVAENLLRVDAERIDAVLNLVGELIIGKSMLTQSINEFDRKFAKDPLKSKFADALSFQARVLNDLQKSVMKIRMVPVEQLFRRFPRVVRDVSKAVGKEVELVLNGQETDLDKSILDVLAEPLAHLVRNAIDHGIEKPEERLAAGKPRQGEVCLNAYHQGNQIVIEVSDNGKGIDRDRVVKKAIERGVITHDDLVRMTEQEVLALIFHPGLSTAEQVTSISGRGVGMDVVKTVLERLKGTVQIDTRPGEGTRFLLKVPLTLAIIKALLFRAADRLYAVPLASVVEITRAMESDVHRVDQHEVVQLRNEVLTLVRLHKLTRKRVSRPKKIFVVIIALADRKFGLVVDKLVGEEELVIKALDDHLVATDFVSGASILGDGTVVLILNINSVVSRLGKADPLTTGATA